MLNNIQLVPDPRENQHVKIDLTAKPKEGINILRNKNKILNSQSNNENSNPGKNRPLNPAKGTTTAHFLSVEGDV